MNAVLNLNIIATGRRAATVLSTTQKQTQALTGSMNAATAAAGRMNMAMRMRNLDRFSKDLQWVGRQIEFNFTLPLLLAGGFAMKWALDNEKAMTRVRKVYDAFNPSKEAEELEQLGTSFRLLSDIMGVHQDEVIGIGAAWAQAGANGARLAEATRLTMEVMILGDFGSEDAVKNLIAVQQQYNLAVTDSSEATFSLTDAMASLNAIENATAVSFQDLTTVLAKSGGIARQAGVDINTLAAMTASLVPAAGTATEAGTALKTTIMRIMAPTNQAAEAMNALGIDVNSTAWASKNFKERLDAVRDGLSDVSRNQAMVALRHISGLRHGSRVAVLLDDLTNKEGKYARAIEVTSSQLKAKNTYDRELLRYLQSQPQQFAILTTQMRNLLTQGFQPLIPYVLELLGSVRNLMHAFTELPQRTQRMIFYLMLFIALVGPAMRIMGAFGLLFTRLGFGLMWLGKTFGWVAGAVGKAMGFMSGAVMGAFTLMSKAILLPFTGLRKLGLAVMATMKFIALSFSVGLTAAASFVGKGLPKIVLMMATGASKLYLLWGKMWAALTVVSAAGMAAVKGVLVGGFRAFALIFATNFKKLGLIAARGFLFLFTSPLALAITAAVGIIYAFRDEIGNFIQDLIRAWNMLPQGVAGSLRAVINVIKQAALAIYDWLSYINPFARHSPSLVENVKAGVAIIAAEYASLSNIGQSFSKAINDLRAFGRATAEAQKQARTAEFGEMRADVVSLAPGAGDEFDAMVRSVYRLESALAAIQVEYDKQARVVAEWEKALENANFELEAQELILEGLEAQAASLGDELSAAKDRLSALSDTPIQGMQAYSDAIFENEMAQRRLRLEMLRLEEAHGTVDDLRDRMAGLSGDIEMLGGQRETLRQAGAGSDVLGALDAQIAMLEAERRELNNLDSGPMAEMGKLEQQLADLQKQGEILDLEQSIKFDPLTRQLDQLANGMEEVPFDVLLADVTAAQEEVARLTKEYDAANAAVAAQQAVVDQLTLKRNAIEATYDMELDKLDQLADAYNGIEDQISAMLDAMSQFASTAAAAKAASGAAGAGGDILGPEGDFDIPGGAGANLQGGDLEALNEAWAAELEAMFDYDIMAILRRKWAEAKAWMSEQWRQLRIRLAERGINLDAIIHGTKEAFSNFGEGIREKISEVIEGVGDFDFSGILSAIEPITTALSEFWEILKGFFIDTWAEIQENWTLGWDDINAYFQAAKNIWTGIIAVLIAAFTLIWPIVRNTFETALNFIREVIGGIIQIFSGIIKFIGGIFTGDWDRAWEGIWDIFSGIVEIIVAAAVALANWFGDIFTGLVEGVADLWNWFFERTRGFWESIGSWLSDKWNSIKSKANEIWTGLRDAVVNKWQELKWKVELGMYRMKARIGEIWLGIKSSILEKWQSLKDTLGKVGTFLRDNVTKPFEAMKNAVRRVWNGLAVIVGTVWNGMAEAINSGIRGVESAIQSLINVWNATAGRMDAVRIDVEIDIPDVPKVNVGTSSGSGGGKSYVPPGIADLHTGAVLRKPTIARMAEYAGATTNPEIVTPERLMRQVFSDTLEAHGSGKGGSIIQINGNLEFPNISNGEDAEEFVRNLEAMVN